MQEVLDFLIHQYGRREQGQVTECSQNSEFENIELGVWT
jgi:hypothetical protein